MAFPEIQLDDRKFEELFHEAKRRIPAYIPEWTDHNETDPGIAMLQLFTWLQEMVIWRLNRVPEKNYLKFLDMIGIEQKPAAAARVDLTFKVSHKDNKVTIPVPRGTKVQLAEAGDGGPVVFETDMDLGASAVDIGALQIFDGAQFSLIRPENLGQGKQFLPFGPDPRQNSALYLGFTEAFPKDRTFKLRVYGAESLAAEALKAAGGPADLLPVSGSWEYSAKDSQWKPLRQVSDSTLALTRTGWVEFLAPDDAEKRPLGALVKPEDPKFVWFRFRIAQVLGSGFERTPALEQVLVNTVSATNAITEELELIGASNGRPNQKFKLANKQLLPLDPGLAGVIEVMESVGSWALWTEVKSFDRSVRDSKHYVLNRSSGELSFGDGIRGKIPAWLQGDASSSEKTDLVNIRATRYRWGGGKLGNAGPGKITSLQSPVPYIDSVTNLRASAGGRNEETVREAAQSAPMQLRTSNRAVTAEDFEFLARQTPGAEIARARAFPLLHPRNRLRRTSVTGEAAPEAPMPGVLTVVVVPKSDQTQPMPNEQTLRLVADELDKHRLVTSELYVAPPRYRKVQIQVTVAGKATVAAESLEQEIRDRLLRYFHPLTGGSDGAGWEFGGTIYFSGTYREILSLEGVVRIQGELRTIVDDEIQPACTDVQLEPDQLVFSEEHVVRVVYL
ncbi:MAG: putative baseplate assembly protein [Acidobacteriota bacterium]|jgi:hypothetical protein